MQGQPFFPPMLHSLSGVERLTAGVGELCSVFSPQPSKELGHRALGKAFIQVGVRVWPCYMHFSALAWQVSTCRWDGDAL